mmetsp:Transcript_74673/g.86699  ORF Transcript_74673/g.86699 Transcript_74673/m.86699 type:complete len:246 (-) Transcript_74673:119-856(-)
MNNTNSTPLLNAQGNVGIQQGGDSGAPEPTMAQSQNRRQFANKYQKNAMLMQETFDLSQAGHPVACICTIIFKVLAIASYLILNAIANQILAFIMVIVFSAVDFWVVKNVTGRLLVGLRWWSAPNDEGDEDWYFESYDQRLIPNAVDSKFFWYSQISLFVFWLVFSVFSVLGFRFFWGSACIIALMLAGTNLWGYYKCSKDHEKKVTEFMNKAGSKAVTKAVNRLTGNTNSSTAKNAANNEGAQE